MTRREETLREYLKVVYRRNKVIIRVGALIAMVVVVYIALLLSTNGEEIAEVTDKTDEDIVVESFEATVKTTEKKVYITGEVNYPGVYPIKEGDRIVDVIKYAGGETSEAVLENVNLSEIVSDEQHIIIPNINDDIAVATGTVEAGGKININKATESDLVSLNGIGEATAKDIIKYREDNGAFKNIEDIMNVSGIGQKTFEKFKDNITVK